MAPDSAAGWTHVRVSELFEEAEFYDFDPDDAERIAAALNKREVGFRG